MRVGVSLPLLLGAQSRFPHDVIMMIPGDLSQAAEKDASGDTSGKGVEPDKNLPVVQSEGKKKSKKKLSKKERYVAPRNVSHMLALHKCTSCCKFCLTCLHQCTNFGASAPICLGPLTFLCVHSLYWTVSQ